MPQFGPMPISKTYFKFVANDKAINHLENMEASVFPDGFKVLSSEYASSGKRILIVTDRVSKDDLDEGMLLSGNEAGVYDNLLAWALNDKDPDIQIKQVVAFNWPFAWLKNDKNKEQIDEARGLYLARLKRFIDRWKPHAVVLAGADMYSYIFDSLVGRYPHKMYANRLISVNWGNHTCPTLGTIDLYRPISWDNKFSKTYPHLLGYLGRGIATAMNGRNRFSAVLPKKNEITFSYISNIDQFKAFYKGLWAAKRVSIDTETTSLARAHNTLLSIQFAWALDRAFFIPIDHPETPFSAKEIRYIKRKLADYFENGISQFHVYQNGKFDVCQLFGLGVRFNNHRIYDVQGGEFALDENRKILQVVLGVKPYSLDFIAEQRGCSIYRQISFSKGDRGSIKDQHLPNKVDQKRKSSKNSLVIYGCYDVLVPLAIVNAQIKEAKHRQFKKFLLFVCEQLGDATHAFSQMEYSGYHVDKAYLFKLKSKEGPLSTKIAEAASKLRASKAVQQVNRYLMDKKGVPQGGGLFGNSTWVFDINKPAHLQLLFFNALKLEPLDVRKDGGGKTGKEFQEKYKTVPEIADYNQYQKLKTLRDTFVNGIYSRMSRDIDALRDNNIRSNYSYTTVVTSRTSSADPNLQNIPTRGMLAKIIKRMFIAIVGCLFVKNDYSAHEIRDWANESDDRNLSASFYAGLKYRQDLRLVAYSYPEQAIAWSEHKAKHGWFDAKDYNKKLEILDKVKDKITKGIGKAELELEIKGDVHKLNCGIFYQTPVLEVTDDQRQDIKALVFGTVYGKTAEGLARTLNKSDEYAQGLQDTLFEKFPRGAKWLRQVERNGQKNLYVESPLGAQRHLWGYLHTRKGVVNAMNRRGPNSIIQGVASSIGISSIRIMQKLIWFMFTKQGVPFHWRSTINYVHDSVESETKYHLIPIYLYLIEHASTTLIHRRYRKIFDYKLNIGLELEFQLGASVDRVSKWNFMADSLFAKIEQEMKWQKDELGYKPDFKHIDLARHNWKIIADVRKEELAESVKSKKPAEIMLLTPKNVNNVGFKIGLPENA